MHCSEKPCFFINDKYSILRAHIGSMVDMNTIKAGILYFKQTNCTEHSSSFPWSIFSYTKGIFQAGHADTLIDLATGLGLFKDTDAITADNYETMKNRTYRASTRNTFSSNMAFVLYNCGGSGTENYALQIVYNGKPLTIPKCNSEACWYRDFRLAYKHFIDDCDWNKVCSVNDGQHIVG